MVVVESNVELVHCLLFAVDKEEVSQQNKSITQIIIDEDVAGLRSCKQADQIRMSDGKNIAHLACCYKKSEILGEILKLYPHLVRNKDVHYCEPLHYAACSSDVRLAEQLVAAGADPRASAKGVHPIHKAAMGGSVGMIKFFQKYEKVEVKDGEGNTPYHWASRFQKRAALEYLHSQGCDRNARNYYGETPYSIFKAHVRRC